MNQPIPPVTADQHHKNKMAYREGFSVGVKIGYRSIESESQESTPFYMVKEYEPLIQEMITAKIFDNVDSAMSALEGLLKGYNRVLKTQEEIQGL